MLFHEYELIITNSFNLPSFILRVMVPSDLFIFQHFRNFNETSQMNTLTISYHDFFFQHTRITNVTCFIANVLKNINELRSDVKLSILYYEYFHGCSIKIIISPEAVLIHKDDMYFFLCPTRNMDREHNGNSCHIAGYTSLNQFASHVDLLQRTKIF